MQPARLRTDLLRDCCGEGDDVVLYLRFDVIDALQVEIAFVADGRGGLARHNAVFSQRFDAAVSTFSHMRYLFSSVQMAPMPGRV